MPRFVLLEHRWNGVHYDLMLETGAGGPLRTWAIDAEVVAGRDLPARALGDHRAAYLDTPGDRESEVSGGRGTVRKVDGGAYEPLEWSDDRVRVRLAGAQLVGEAELWKDEGAGAGGASAPRKPAPAWTFRLGNLD